MASLKALVQQQAEEIERLKALLEAEQQAAIRAREDADSLSLALEESELKREKAEDESKRLKVQRCSCAQACHAAWVGRKSLFHSGRMQM